MAALTTNMRFPVGTRFIRLTPHKKSKVVETICDFHVTRNLAGDLVKVRYVCTHAYMGQTLIDWDVTETTIARAELVTD